MYEITTKTTVENKFAAILSVINAGAGEIIDNETGEVILSVDHGLVTCIGLEDLRALIHGAENAEEPAEEGKGYEFFAEYDPSTHEFSEPTDHLAEAHYVRVFSENGLAALHKRALAEGDATIQSITTVGDWAFNVYEEYYQPWRK